MFSQTQTKEVEEILRFLYDLMSVLRDLFQNGTEPTLGAAPGYEKWIEEIKNDTLAYLSEVRVNLVVPDRGRKKRIGAGTPARGIGKHCGARTFRFATALAAITASATSGPRERGGVGVRFTESKSLKRSATTVARSLRPWVFGRRRRLPRISHHPCQDLTAPSR